MTKIDSEVDKNKCNIHYYRASVKLAKLSLSHISECRDSGRLCHSITACFSHQSCSCYWYTQSTHCPECSNLLCSSDQHLSVFFNCLTKKRLFSPIIIMKVHDCFKEKYVNGCLFIDWRYLEKRRGKQSRGESYCRYLTREDRQTPYVISK